jgi:hypothetical protein
MQALNVTVTGAALLRSTCVVVVCVAAAGCGAADGSVRSGVEYRPAADAARLVPEPLEGDDIGLIRDFDLSGDTLYLLDGAGHVVVAERRGAGWAVAGSFGRSGGGPGEFLTATGISASSAAIAVIDNTRLQFFSRGGEHTHFHSLDLPCVMMRARVAQGLTGLFVHGGCSRGSFVTDTMKAVLAWSADTAEWSIIAEDVRYTRDGTVGNLFTAASALTPGAAGVHLFGSGATNCVWTVSDSTFPPTAVQRCPAARGVYRSDAPPGVRERLRSGAVGGARLDWPETLPIFVERIHTKRAILLIRPFSADSVVLQEAAPSGRDVAVAPLDGLVGCKAAGCLWVLVDSLPARLIVLDSTVRDATGAPILQ